MYFKHFGTNGFSVIEISDCTNDFLDFRVYADISEPGTDFIRFEIDSTVLDDLIYSLNEIKKRADNGEKVH